MATRTDLWQKPANEIALKKIAFLKDCSIYGVDIFLKEMGQDPNSLDAFDPITDTYPTEIPLVTRYIKSALPIPLTTKAIDQDLQGHVMKTGVAFGFKIQGIDVNTDMIARVKIQVPLNPIAVYDIAGNAYKVKEILDSPSYGTKKTLWNLVWFSSAGVSPLGEVAVAAPVYIPPPDPPPGGGGGFGGGGGGGA